MGHLRLESVAHARIHKLELVCRVGRQQVALAAIASEVREVGSGGLAMQIVEDSNAFAAIQTRGGSDLRHVNKSVVFTQGLVGPRLLLKAHPHV